MIGHTRNVNPLGGSNFSPAGNTAIATLQDVMGSDTWMLKPTMINVARASMNRIDAKPTVTSGLDLRDLGFNIDAEQPDRRGAAVHHRHRLLHDRRRAAAVRHPREQRVRRSPTI